MGITRALFYFSEKYIIYRDEEYHPHLRFTTWIGLTLVALALIAKFG